MVPLRLCVNYGIASELFGNYISPTTRDDKGDISNKFMYIFIYIFSFALAICIYLFLIHHKYNNPNSFWKPYIGMRTLVSLFFSTSSPLLLPHSPSSPSFFFPPPLLLLHVFSWTENGLAYLFEMWIEGKNIFLRILLSYVDVLPEEYSTPIFWSSDELELLRGSPMFGKQKKQKTFEVKWRYMWLSVYCFFFFEEYTLRTREKLRGKYLHWVVPLIQVRKILRKWKNNTLPSKILFHLKNLFFPYIEISGSLSFACIHLSELSVGTCDAMVTFFSFLSFDDIYVSITSSMVLFLLFASLFNSITLCHFLRFLSLPCNFSAFPALLSASLLLLLSSYQYFFFFLWYYII